MYGSYMMAKVGMEGVGYVKMQLSCILIIILTTTCFRNIHVAATDVPTRQDAWDTPSSLLSN